MREAVDRQLRCPYCFNPMRGVDLLPHLQAFHVDTNDFDPGPITKLLHEWYRWWLDTNDAPAKMPKALHIRTAMALQALGFDVVPDQQPPGGEPPPDTSWVEVVEIVDFEK